MVNEDVYKIYERPYISEIDEMIIVLRKGTARRPLNQLEDKIAEATMSQLISSNDDLYTWVGFKSMIENEYGYILDEAIAANPTDPYAAIVAWLEGYSQAHNSPLINIDGWEGSGYPSQVGEPLVGLIPPEV
jgi:hypothetical protein